MKDIAKTGITGQVQGAANVMGNIVFGFKRGRFIGCHGGSSYCFLELQQFIGKLLPFQGNAPKWFSRLLFYRYSPLLLDFPI
jgi:hypothetical protein